LEKGKVSFLPLSRVALPWQEFGSLRLSACVLATLFYSGIQERRRGLFCPECLQLAPLWDLMFRPGRKEARNGLDLLSG